MKEIWKSLKNIVEHGDNYEVSDLGNVRNAVTKKVLKGVKNHKGYLRVSLMLNGKPKHHFIHKLVALAFIPNPENKAQVNHKKGKEKDNNRVDNLEWATRSENMKHAYDTGLETVKKGEETNSAKLTEAEVIEIKKMLASNTPQSTIAAKLGIGKGHVSSIKSGRIWSHVHVDGFTPTQKWYSKYSDELRETVKKLYASGEYTQAEIGKKLGISQRTVSHIVNQKHVD